MFSILKRSFLHDVMVLMTGSLGAQALGFLLMPVVTRLYSVQNFGFMALFSAIGSAITVVSCACYQQAIVLPKEDLKAWHISILSFMILVGVTLLTITGVIILAFPAFHHYFCIEWTAWWWFLPVSVFLAGIRLILIFWNTRKKEFTILSLSNVSDTTGNSGIKIINGFSFGDKVGGLITGVIGGSLFPVLVLGFNFCRKSLSVIPLEIKKNILFSVARDYRNFPLFSTWIELLNNFSRSIPVFFFAYLFDNSAVGAFGLATNTLKFPVALVGESVRRVFLQKTASMASERKLLSNYMLITTMWLFLIAIIPFAIIGGFGPFLFTLVFGSDWTEAGKYAQIMTPWIFTLFINPPATVIYTVLEKQRERLGLFIISVILQIFCFLIGMHANFDIIDILFLLTSVSTLMNFIRIIYAYLIAISYDKRIAYV